MKNWKCHNLMWQTSWNIEKIVHLSMPTHCHCHFPTPVSMRQQATVHVWPQTSSFTNMCRFVSHQGRGLRSCQSCLLKRCVWCWRSCTLKSNRNVGGLGPGVTEDSIYGCQSFRDNWRWQQHHSSSSPRLHMCQGALSSYWSAVTNCVTGDVKQVWSISTLQPPVWAASQPKLVISVYKEAVEL